MTIDLQDYYSRYGTGQHGDFERVLYRTGRVVQCAELNETQEAQIDRVRRIADFLFKDGSVMRDAQIVVNADTGAVTAESGAIYVRGAVRNVAPATFIIPITGTVHVGLYLRDTVVTELEDPSLRDPAVDVENYHEGGAARLIVETAWGCDGDGQEGEFYPVYTVVNGVILSKDPPPQIDAVAVAIGDYDRQSAGGYYTSTGLRLTKLPDLGSGEQVYSLQEGVARINGREVNLPHAQRLVYNATPDLKQVTAEPHAAAGGSERVTLNHGPVQAINQVTITAERTIDVTHGGYAGVLDALPDTPVVSLVSVTQGATTYVQGTDYKLTSDKVDWSLPGGEPAPGSTYRVTYRYIKIVAPTAVDSTGFTVGGAVPGSLINTTYQWAMPRIDRLCLTTAGEAVWVVGVASENLPQAPDVPAGMLALASVKQTWDSDRQVINDGTRTLPMTELETMRRQISDLFQLAAIQALQLNLAINEPAAKKGIFTDAFYDDDMRDQGIAQTAAIVDGQLVLPIEAAVLDPRISERVTLTYTLEPVLEQTKRSTTMLVNPYQAFDPIPAKVILNPAVDQWTDVQVTWTSAATRQFTYVDPSYHANGRSSTSTSSGVELLSSRTDDLAFLRQRDVAFTLEGFGPGEALAEVTFDGVTVTPTTLS